jgi:hypothetical protein
MLLFISAFMPHNSFIYAAQAADKTEYSATRRQRPSLIEKPVSAVIMSPVTHGISHL